MPRPTITEMRSYIGRLRELTRAFSVESKLDLSREDLLARRAADEFQQIDAVMSLEVTAIGQDVRATRKAGLHADLAEKDAIATEYVSAKSDFALALRLIFVQQWEKGAG